MGESKCLNCGAVLPALNIGEDTSPVAFLFGSVGRVCAQCALKRTITMKTIHKLQALVRPAKVPTVEVRVEGGVAEIHTKPAGVRVILRDYDVDYHDRDDPNVSRDDSGKCCWETVFGVEEEI